MYEKFLTQDDLPADIRNLFLRLQRGSRNHLRAFQNNLRASSKKSLELSTGAMDAPAFWEHFAPKWRKKLNLVQLFLLQKIHGWFFEHADYAVRVKYWMAAACFPAVLSAKFQPYTPADGMVLLP